MLRKLVFYIHLGQERELSPKYNIVAASRLLAVHIELSANIQKNQHHQIRRSVLKFCQVDKISIRICVFACRQLCLCDLLQRNTTKSLFVKML